MLPFQVGVIEVNRPGNKGLMFGEPAVRPNRAYRRLPISLLSIVLSVLIAGPQVSGQSKGRKNKAGTSAKAGRSPGEQSLTNIPLPIGHEAKGLVLPDFDGDGRLRGKFEARSEERRVGKECRSR